MDDFYKICKQVTKDTDGDGAIDQYGCAGYNWQQAIAAYGGKLFNATGTKAYFDSSKVKKALSLITQLKALNGNYDVTSKDFDEGKVAFLPMSLATYRTYKPYPYHIAKYPTFFGLVSPYQLAKKEWIRPKYQLRFMLFLLKLDTARQLGNF